MAKNTNTATTTRTTTHAAEAAASGNPLSHYSGVLKGWPTKYAGAKPTADNFKVAHSLGARPGTKTAIALAMYLRSNGATQAEVVVINKGPYLNKMRDVINAGHAKREPMPVTAEGHTVYKLALPAKGKATGKGKGNRKAATAAKGKAADKAAPAAKGNGKATPAAADKPAAAPVAAS